MEISKSLQEEILSVQNKLKNAICDHQICVVKLKDDPNNTDILDRIREIQLHIVSLGRWQKQVVQRLRKEIESLKAENPLNGAKLSVASLLGLNNNNHITNNNEAARRVGDDVNGNSESRASSKEDYEEIVRNGDVGSPLQDSNADKERRSSSTDPASGDEVVEIPTEAESPEPEVEEDPKDSVIRVREQQYFLSCLGLITSARLLELQNKRAERKRRSTANSHFVYSNWEVPMKRKRHAYLQSLGNAPQTRQTTARLNGPSPPPPTKNNSGSKSSGLALRGASSGVTTKSLSLQVTKTSNILRNGDGKQQQQQQPKDLFKSIKQETDKLSARILEPHEKHLQTTSTSTGRVVHIPGLPSGLTIERIENDSTVCVTCRNPGTLTVCEYCSAKFHVSCHTTSPASSCYCPKCAARFRSKGLTTTDLEILRFEMKSMKKDKETEERERVRYELRERNTDLRIQVYELEKRSQLISQSLQLQQVTHRELLETQEKIQKFIKQTLDFAKPMQLKPGSSSPPRHSVSTSCHPRPSSYQSPPPQTTRCQSPSSASSLSVPPPPHWAHRRELSHQLQCRDSATILSNSSSSTNNLRSSSTNSRSHASGAPPPPPPPPPTLSQGYYSVKAKGLSPMASQSSLLRNSPTNLLNKDDGVPKEVQSNRNQDVQFSITNGRTDPVLGRSLSNPSSRSPTLAITLPSKYSVTTMLELSKPAKIRPIAFTSLKAPQECQISLNWNHQQSMRQKIQSLSSSESSEAQRIHSLQSRTKSFCNGDQEFEGDNVNSCNDGINGNVYSYGNNYLLNSVFPGRYGYKIDVVDVESSSSSSCEQPSDSPDGHAESETDEHVKLEKTHISASPGTDLAVKESVDDVGVDIQDMKLEDDNVKIEDENVKYEDQDAKLEDEDMKLEVEDMKLEDEDLKLEVEETKIKTEEMTMVKGTDSKQLIIVPDNKSDDAAKQNYRDEDDDCDGQGCP